MMTRQEIFDKAMGGIIAQGEKSWNGGCRYAGPKGTACAIGQLLPRAVAEEWDRLGSFSIRSLSDDESKFPHRVKKSLKSQLEAAEVPTDPYTLSFLYDLQAIHDVIPGLSPDFVERFRDNARYFARRYDLNPRVLG